MGLKPIPGAIVPRRKPKIKINYLRDNIITPKKATEGSSGYDLHAVITRTGGYIDIYPGERTVIDCGFAIELPKNCEAQIRSRSGLASKYGIVVANAPGTVDSDYRGEIKVILANISNQVFTVHNGHRIAQMVFKHVPPVDLVEVDCLGETKRGDGGMGSTGI